MKEAAARIKINRLLEEAGWRFFDDDKGRANIVLEPNTKVTETQIHAMGDDFQTVKNGFIDFLLLDNDGRPQIVLEAKSESKNPLSAKEQARRYAREQNARFVVLSNGNIHYLWDLKQGNPNVITKFPSPGEIKDHHAFEPDPERLGNEIVDNDYIAVTQMPSYMSLIDLDFCVSLDIAEFADHPHFVEIEALHAKACAWVETEDALAGA